MRRPDRSLLIYTLAYVLTACGIVAIGAGASFFLSSLTLNFLLFGPLGVATWTAQSAVLVRLRSSPLPPALRHALGVLAGPFLSLAPAVAALALQLPDAKSLGWFPPVLAILPSFLLADAARRGEPRWGEDGFTDAAAALLAGAGTAHALVFWLSLLFRQAVSPRAAGLGIAEYVCATAAALPGAWAGYECLRRWRRRAGIQEAAEDDL